MNSQVKVTQESLLSERRYVREDAEDILNLADDVLREFLKIDSDGVWISHQYPVGLSWVPNMELDGPDSPNPRTHPALPFPFSPNQLAAFFLHGIGSVVRECIGEWADGPDDAVLLRLPDQSKKAVEVLRFAYRTYQVAATVCAAHEHPGSEDGCWRKQMCAELLKFVPVLDPNRFRSVMPTDVVGDTAEQRQARRYNMCVEAGLTLPDNDFARLPRGISKLAAREGVTHQAFSADVKKHINRLAGKNR